MIGLVATECVRIVVDRTAAETYCTNVAEGSNAAQALARRADALKRPQPRYDGNFLCAIDGYPEAPECGNDPPNPYWSVWYFKSGKWVYSSLGVGDLLVEDRDHDGHPDPLGFRFLKVDDKKEGPRANPGYPSPTPSKVTPTPTRTSSPTTQRTTPPPAPPTTARLTTPRAVETSASGEPSTTPPGETSAPPTEAVEPPRSRDGGFPVGTAAGAILAAALLGSAAWRFRRS